MGSAPEQYDYHGTKPSWRKWKKRLKRLASRLARRQGKKLQEDAPPRSTKGWAS